jgi:Predicted unusual protein kinase
MEEGVRLNIWDMRRTYVNIRRLRQILTILAKHGFSHFLERMRIVEYLPWVGRHLEKNAARKEHTPDSVRDLPNRLVAAFEELGPVYIKLGQILASRPDLIPADFQRAFVRMQDSVQPNPGEEITPVIEKALGKPLAAVFASFTAEADAAGSIGQVHWAELLDGTHVIVKVKHPDIEKSIDEDLSLLGAMAELIETHIPELSVVRPKMLVRELRRTLSNELDFVGEAAYATKFRESMCGDERIAIPRIFWDHVSRNMLVMEREEGKSVSDLAFLPDRERSRVARVIADCFMKQYFETGLFHADPHPGNLLYRSDGKIALIDFGQVGHLSNDLRRGLGRMLMSLKDGDTDAIVDVYSEIGEFAPESNMQGFRFELADFIDRNYGTPVERIDFSATAQEILAIARRNGLYLPRDFVLLVKSVMLAASVIRDLDPAFRLDIAVTPAVKRLALSMYRPDVMARRGMRLASRFAGLIRRMPDDVRDLMEKARAGRFTIVFRHDNLHNVFERIGRAADRLTLGMIAAAVIIGSSIVLAAGQSGMMRGYTIPIFGGLPVAMVLASLGFLAALLVAVYVAWGIFRDKS